MKNTNQHSVDTDTPANQALAIAPGLILPEPLGVRYVEHNTAEALPTLAHNLRQNHVGATSPLWGLMPVDRSQQLINAITQPQAEHPGDQHPFPLNTAGDMMATDFQVFFIHQTAGQVLQHFRHTQTMPHPEIYLMDGQGALAQCVSLNTLVIAPEDATLGSLGEPITSTVNPLSDRTEVLHHLIQKQRRTLPVVDTQQRLIGVIHNTSLVAALPEPATPSALPPPPTERRATPSVSMYEPALATSRIAVRRRQAWLQVNLITIFISSMVLAFFEQSAIHISTLALLLPVACGLAGSTGAQALAVTMRSLALGEITTKHWRQIALKEAKAASLNGLAVATTAALGVFIWRHSLTLTSIVATALLLSMVFAATLGSLVPLVLKHWKLDPAHSAAIVLTTLMDLIGPLIFLTMAALFLNIAR